jgi:riboflavin kinase/FMN adenylyltransferase
MHTLIQADNFRKVTPPVFLATGFFDGLHLGHRRVLETAVNQAHAVGGSAWALTFDQHPLSILAPERRPPLLTTICQRLDLFASVGLDGCLMLPFTRELANLTPVEFIALITNGPAKPVKAICCGDNWRFGQKAAGSPTWLRTEAGIDVTIVPPALPNAAPVSRTRSRVAVTQGDLTNATAMLGRPYSIREIVRHGRGIARTLGMATANFHPAAEVMPPVGVYAVRSSIGDRTVDGVASLGWRPTFADARPESPVLEVHFFDFHGDLYGAQLEISFVGYIRNEVRFDSPAALVQQVESDITAARKIFNNLPPLPAS